MEATVCSTCGYEDAFNDATGEGRCPICDDHEYESCPECDGTGRADTRRCPACDGEGADLMNPIPVSQIPHRGGFRFDGRRWRVIGSHPRYVWAFAVNDDGSFKAGEEARSFDPNQLVEPVNGEDNRLSSM